MAVARYVVTVDDDEARCDTEEAVSKIVAKYQMDHPEDLELAGITVIRAGSGEPVAASYFLPQQLP